MRTTPAALRHGLYNMNYNVRGLTSQFSSANENAKQIIAHNNCFSYLVCSNEVNNRKVPEHTWLRNNYHNTTALQVKYFVSQYNKINKIFWYLLYPNDLHQYLMWYRGSSTWKKYIIYSLSPSSNIWHVFCHKFTMNSVSSSLKHVSILRYDVIDSCIQLCIFLLYLVLDHIWPEFGFIHLGFTHNIFILVRFYMNFGCE